MAKNSKKTSSPAVRVPITQGFVDEMGRELHFALMGMDLGSHTAGNWRRAARALLVLSIASDGSDRVGVLDKTAVDAAVVVLDQIARRCRGNSEWDISKEEMLALRRGVIGAEAMLPWLDSRDIQRARAYADLLETS